MAQLKEKKQAEDLKALLRYFKIMLRVLKRIKNEYENNPTTILNDLEPEFCLFIYLFIYFK